MRRPEPSAGIWSWPVVKNIAVETVIAAFVPLQVVAPLAIVGSGVEFQLEDCITKRLACFGQQREVVAVTACRERKCLEAVVIDGEFGDVCRNAHEGTVGGQRSVDNCGTGGGGRQDSRSGERTSVRLSVSAKELPVLAEATAVVVLVGGGYCLQPLIEAFLKEDRIYFTRKSSIGKVTLQPEVRAFGMILRCQMQAVEVVGRSAVAFRNDVEIREGYFAERTFEVE